MNSNIIKRVIEEANYIIKTEKTTNIYYKKIHTLPSGYGHLKHNI